MTQSCRKRSVGVYPQRPMSGRSVAGQPGAFARNKCGRYKRDRGDIIRKKCSLKHY